MVINRILNFMQLTDWRGYKILRKAWILPYFTVKPLKVWEKYPEDFYRAFEVDQNDLCKDRELMNHLIKLKYGNGNIRVLMSIREMINIYNLVQKTRDLGGDMAEVGVYQGGSARIISIAKGDKMLHLFDTFEGLPMPHETYDDDMLEGDMHDTSIEICKRNLADYENLAFYKGLFPETVDPVKNKKFCFVNNDTDLYSSTLSFLEFFYPRMVRGGIILTHDYNDSRTPGVKKAYDEFFADRSEFIVEIWDTQAYVVKT